MSRDKVRGWHLFIRPLPLFLNSFSLPSHNQLSLKLCYNLNAFLIFWVMTISQYSELLKIMRLCMLTSYPSFKSSFWSSLQITAVLFVKISLNKATPIKNVFAPRQLAGARAMAEGKSAAFILSKAPPFAN